MNRVTRNTIANLLEVFKKENAATKQLLEYEIKFRTQKNDS
jgi:hypothetical protein